MSENCNKKKKNNKLEAETVLILFNQMKVSCWKNIIFTQNVTKYGKSTSSFPHCSKLEVIFITNILNWRPGFRTRYPHIQAVTPSTPTPQHPPVRHTAVCPSMTGRPAVHSSLDPTAPGKTVSGPLSRPDLCADMRHIRFAVLLSVVCTSVWDFHTYLDE